MAVTFRFARGDEYARIARFLDTFWAKDHVYCRRQDLFQWTFQRRGYWPEDQYSFALAEDGDQLAGILGGIPFSFNAFGKVSRGVWIVNYVISPEHRKGPLALQLLGVFRRPEFDPVIAFGINPATSAIYRVLRGEVLPEIPRHFLVLPEASDRMARLLHVAHPEWQGDEAESLTSFFARPIADATKSFDVRSELPDDWDECDWKSMAETSVGVARDSDFINWRYRTHPVFQYRFQSVRDGVRSGLAVWRLETIRRQTENGIEDFDKIGRLVEFLPSSEQNARQLFTAFINELHQAGALGCDYYGFHGRTRRWLQEIGFPLVVDHPQSACIPTLFQPLDGKKSGGILSAMFLKADVPRQWVSDECCWYWTKADSDQDRPN